jgi:hypothetical protein
MVLREASVEAAAQNSTQTCTYQRFQSVRTGGPGDRCCHASFVGRHCLGLPRCSGSARVEPLSVPWRAENKADRQREMTPCRCPAGVEARRWTSPPRGPRPYPPGGRRADSPAGSEHCSRENHKDSPNGFSSHLGHHRSMDVCLGAPKVIPTPDLGLARERAAGEAGYRPWGWPLGGRSRAKRRQDDGGHRRQNDGSRAHLDWQTGELVGCRASGHGLVGWVGWLVVGSLGRCPSCGLWLSGA